MLQVNAHPDDVRDAIGLLAPDWPGGRVVGYPDFWTVVPSTPIGARTLAPRLAPMLGVRVVTVTVDETGCQFWLVHPDGRQLGPVDGRGDGRGPADELAAAFGKSNGPGLASVLADTSRAPLERQRAVSELLGLPFPDFDELHGRPGVALVWAPATTVRDRLPVDGHGAWVLPYGPELALVVPDGSGVAPRPDTFTPVLATKDDRDLPVVGVHWGNHPTLTANGKWGDASVDLSARDATVLSCAGGNVAKAVDRPELEALVEGTLGSTEDPEGRATELLRGLGAGTPPVGGAVERLAAWAAEQPDAIHVPARDDTAPTLRTADPARLASRFRRRRTIRRVRRGVLVGTVAAGVGVLYSWSEARFSWLLAAGAVFAVLLLVWIGLGRLLPPLGRQQRS
jgi:hypothetical protein